MKRLMIVHILCAGLLMLSMESQGASKGAGAGKKGVPKQEEKKKAAVGTGTEAGVPATPAIPKAPTAPRGELDAFFADVAAGDISAMEKKIESNKNLLTMFNASGDTALIVASRAGRKNSVEYLLFRYIDFSKQDAQKIIEHKNKEGKNALDYAEGKLQIMGLLLNALGKEPTMPVETEIKMLESCTIENPANADYAQFFASTGATVSAFEDALFYLLLFWIENSQNPKRQTYLGQLIGAYKRAGGSMKGVIGEVVTGLPSYTRDAGAVERTVMEVVPRLLSEGATLGKISQHSKPALIQLIKDIQRRHEQEYTKPLGWTNPEDVSYEQQSGQENEEIF